METKKLPVGVEDFKKIIQQNYYYVDKTDFIAQTFQDEVALYTRPRRFGKTLNMSMLKYFYSIKEKPEKPEDDLFKRLKISDNKEAAVHKNRYPVISLSLKDLKKNNFNSLLNGFSTLMQSLFESFPELHNSEHLSRTEKKRIEQYLEGTTDPDELSDSLQLLSRYLHKHYQEKVVILIDEYDVPLDSAFQSGYSDQMVDFIRSFLSQALKTNDSLEKGILTGCLRISQESIFTGLNNLSVYSVLESKGASSFGFTQSEIEQMYAAYGFEDKLAEVRKWYDGYLFGKVEIYNPWSAFQYLNALLYDPDESPVCYWANSSSNSLITRYIENADEQMRKEFQDLVDGRSITKKIEPNLTYREMENPNNIYSFLLLTGYLKAVGKGKERNSRELEIPNLEVREIFEDHFSKYFDEYKEILTPKLLEALKKGDEQTVQDLITRLLDLYISFFDQKEDFCHGFMLGILSERTGWKPVSNREEGDGRPDISLISDYKDCLAVIECKRSVKERDLEKDADEAIRQIIKNRYKDHEKAKEYSKRIAYGISFYKKSCLVKKVDNFDQ